MMDKWVHFGKSNTKATQLKVQTGLVAESENGLQGHKSP